MPWPNLECPVAMVECDSGRDEQNANESTIMMHGSWHNVAEAELAMRCARRSPVLPVLRGCWLTIKPKMRPGPELMPCVTSCSTPYPSVTKLTPHVHRSFQ